MRIVGAAIDVELYSSLSKTWSPDQCVTIMTGLRFSEAIMARDEITSEETENIEMLMSATEDTEGVVSDGDLNRVRMYLDKVSKVRL